VCLCIRTSRRLTTLPLFFVDVAHASSLSRARARCCVLNRKRVPFRERERRKRGVFAPTITVVCENQEYHVWLFQARQKRPVATAATTATVVRRLVGQGRRNHVCGVQGHCQNAEHVGREHVYKSFRNNREGIGAHWRCNSRYRSSHPAQ
jgi:hypothetical protein